MKIYLIAQGAGYSEFATFAHVGTWAEGAPCPECTASDARLISPLQVEWEPGTNQIGDFSWCGYTCVVQPGVWRFVREAGFECRFFRVEYVPCSSRIRKRDRCVGYPYAGPTLRWMKATRHIALDEKKSGVAVESTCPTCGRIEKTFKYQGIVINSVDWMGCHIFTITQNGTSAATFVTEEGRDLLVSQQFTNIAFHEAGRIG